MIWLITIPLALVAAYAILCLVLNAVTGSGEGKPYWVLLTVSVAIVYIAWFHPVRIAFE